MSRVFILSGLSGTGKSGMIDVARESGYVVLKSFNKFLLDVRFGYGQPTHKFLVMDSFMQAYHTTDAIGYESDKPWMVERSVIDHYFYSIHKNGYVQSETDKEDMNRMILTYFKFLTWDFTKQLVIVDIMNLDKNWINKVLSESKFRSMYWKSYEDYIYDQVKYKFWFFNKLDELKIPYSISHLDVTDLARDFSIEYRDDLIKNQFYLD
jgi:hypothetical protein